MTMKEPWGLRSTRVGLVGFGVQAELTASTHVAHHRYTFEPRPRQPAP